MPESHEVRPTDFIAATERFAGMGLVFAFWQQQESPVEQAAVPYTPEVMDVDAYLASVNRFVVDTTQDIQLQRRYLTHMRPGMSLAESAAIEEEIARTSEVNTEALWQAWRNLLDCGYRLRTRHPETGQVALVAGIGKDEAHTYQTILPGPKEESWDLIDGNQLHL